MKKFLALILAFCMVFALCACGEEAAPAATQEAAPAAEESATTAEEAAPAAEETAAAEDSVIIKIALSSSPTSIAGMCYPAFVESVAERTEGRVTIEMHYSNELGSAADVIEQVSLGANLATSCSYDFWANYGCYDLSAVNTMFLFPDRESIEKFNSSDVMAEMCASLEDNGIKVLTVACIPNPRVVMSVKPINSVEDFQGLIIRVPNETYSSFFSLLGCSCMNMTFSEVYNAMQTGIIEAVEADYSTLCSNSIYEVAKYVYLTNHTYAQAMICTSMSIWNMISAEDQQVILEEFDNLAQVYNETQISKAEEYEQVMKDAGCTFVTPSEEDMEVMSEASMTSFESFGYTEGLYDRIKAACA